MTTSSAIFVFSHKSFYFAALSSGEQCSGADEIVTVPERAMSQQKRRRAADAPRTLRVSNTLSDHPIGPMTGHLRNFILKPFSMLEEYQ